MAIAAVVTINTAAYLLVNAQPLRTPTLLPVTALDQWIGWHAWTIWPYWLLLAMNPFLALCIRQRRLLLATLRAYALAMGINFVVWIAWPTSIVRAALPEGLDGATRLAWQALHALDAPNNCFPSGHITIPVVVMAGVIAQHPRARRWLWLPLLLFPSILTTDQHYFVDLVGGLATALIGIALVGQALWRPAASPAWVQAPTKP